MNPWFKQVIVLSHPALLVCGLMSLGCLCWAEDEFELPPLSYSATHPTDAIAELRSRLETNTNLISSTHDKGFLEALLSLLHVPRESQMLVFSKTSLQRQRISPGNPRGIYFSDNCYVGWVPGGDIEIISFDPVIGATYGQCHGANDPRGSHAR
jgi:hypothetical protein